MRFEECLPRLWTAVGSKSVSTHDRGRFVSPANAKEKRPLLAGNCLCFDDYKWQDFSFSRIRTINRYPVVGFSYASRERNHCEQPFDFPSSMCEVRHTPRDVFDITSSYFAGNHYTADTTKRSSYVAERTRKRQNKFTDSFLPVQI